MRKIIKEYELKEDVTIPKLIEAGFKQKNPTEDDPVLRCYFSKELLDEIELQIDIKPLDKFDFSTDVQIFDTFYGHRFDAFYNEERDYPFLNDLINEYNILMDDLSKKGIFKEKENKKIKRLVNKK